METMRGLFMRFLVTAVFAGLLALTGCAGSGSVASSQFTPQQVTVNGAVNPVLTVPAATVAPAGYEMLRPGVINVG